MPSSEYLINEDKRNIYYGRRKDIRVPKEGEKILTFVRRIIAEQPNPEPLHIVGQLVEIVVSELKGRKCQATVEVSTKSLTVTIRHEGKPIEERMVMLMSDHTDHIFYMPDNSDYNWKLIIQRDIPRLYVKSK